MKARLHAFREAYQSRLWPIPVLVVALSLALGVGLPALDSAVGAGLPEILQTYLFTGGPEAARAVLQAISGSLITVTSLTFSLTVVTLQLASSQFSPRLLRTFTSDGFVHWTLALFLGTFAYSLTVLRSVRTGSPGRSEFVPGISVTVAFVMAVASVIGLALFLAHLTREIRVETMMRNVHAETAATVDMVYPTDAPARIASAPRPEGQTVEASTSGFLNSVNESRLVAAAEGANAALRIDAAPGASVIAGVPFATLWPTDGRERFSVEDLQEIGKAVNAAVTIGFERTNAQDPGFGFRQLADVAARALSPGTNDPTTAEHVIGHLSSLLCLLAARPLGDRQLTDSAGTVRGELTRPGYADFLSLSVSQIRHYGMQDPVVGARLLQLFEEIIWVDPNGTHTDAIGDELLKLRESIEQNSYTSADRRALLEHHQRISSTLKSRQDSR